MALANYGVAHGYQLWYMKNDWRQVLVYCGRNIDEGRCAGKKGNKHRVLPRKVRTRLFRGDEGNQASKKPVKKPIKKVVKKPVKKIPDSQSGEGTSKSPKWTKKQILNSKKVNCPFRLYASWMSREHSFQIKSLRSEHKCCRNYNLGSLVTYKWIAVQYFKEIIEDPFIPLRKMRDDIRQKFMIDVSVGQCKRAKQLALFDHEGGLIEHYAKLYQYRQAILDSNPGSTCTLDVVESDNGSVSFKRMYICFKGVKDGWLAGCRKVIGLDGCFLKHTCRGELLTAMGRDANNQMYPIAWAVVRVENADNWGWFLHLLHDDLCLNDGTGITIISDSHKGLIDAVNDWLPEAEHRKCTRHIYANFKKKYSGLQYQRLFWAAASCTLEQQFLQIIDQIKLLDANAYDYLIQRDPNSWSRAFFEMDRRCATFESKLVITIQMEKGRGGSKHLKKVEKYNVTGNESGNVATTSTSNKGSNRVTDMTTSTSIVDEPRVQFDWNTLGTNSGISNERWAGIDKNSNKKKDSTQVDLALLVTVCNNDMVFLDNACHSVFSSKDGLYAMLKNAPWFIRINPFILKKWNPDVILQKKDVGNVPVWVKFYAIPMTAFIEDDLSINATKLDTPLMLDSYTSDMCMQSWLCQVMLEQYLNCELMKILVEIFQVLSFKLVGHILNVCPKKIVSVVMKNLSNPRQATRGVPVGQKVNFKSTKQIYRPDSNKNGADDDGKPLSKIVSPVNTDSDSEVEENVIEGMGFLAIVGRWNKIDMDCLMIVVYAPQDLHDANLVDLPMRGRKFTRMNKFGTKLSKIDRILVSQAFIIKWPHSNVTALPRDLSDHCTQILKTHAMDYGPIPFKFFNSWINHTDFPRVVSSSWAESIWAETPNTTPPPTDFNPLSISNPPIIINNSHHQHHATVTNHITPFIHSSVLLKCKLKSLKQQIYFCRKTTIPKNDKLLCDLKSKVESLETIVETRNLTTNEIGSRLSFLKQIEDLNHIKGLDLLQKSCIKCAVEGDENTSFFHGMINCKFGKSRINCINIQGSWISNHPLVISHIYNFHKCKYEVSSHNRPQFTSNLFKKTVH
ncbi:calcium/proton exchanger [Tanacetum coccineum]